MIRRVHMLRRPRAAASSTLRTTLRWTTIPRVPHRLAHSAVPEAESEGTSVLRDYVLPLGLWTIVSGWVGAAFSQGDEGVQVLMRVDEFVGILLDCDTKRSVLMEKLEQMSRGTSQNDTLKMRLALAPGVLERLLNLLTSTDTNVTTTARNHAAKVLENLSTSSQAQIELVNRGLHAPLLEVLRAEGTSLYLKKTLAATACNLATEPANLLALGAEGIVSALHGEQEAHEVLRRRRVGVCLGRIGLALCRAMDSGETRLTR